MPTFALWSIQQLPPLMANFYKSKLEKGGLQNDVDVAENLKLLNKQIDNNWLQEHPKDMPKSLRQYMDRMLYQITPEKAIFQLRRDLNQKVADNLKREAEALAFAKQKLPPGMNFDQSFRELEKKLQENQTITIPELEMIEKRLREISKTCAEQLESLEDPDQAPDQALDLTGDEEGEEGSETGDIDQDRGDIPDDVEDQVDTEQEQQQDDKSQEAEQDKLRREMEAKNKQELLRKFWQERQKKADDLLHLLEKQKQTWRSKPTNNFKKYSLKTDPELDEALKQFWKLNEGQRAIKLEDWGVMCIASVLALKTSQDKFMVGTVIGSLKTDTLDNININLLEQARIRYHQTENNQQNQVSNDLKVEHEPPRPRPPGFAIPGH